MMKLRKVLFLIIIILLFQNNIKAKTLYGDYYEVSIKEEKSDIFKIEELKKYNTFEFNYIDMGYLKDNDIYVKDENDYILEKIKNSIYNENNIQNLVVNTNISKIKYFYLRYLPSSLKIYEIELFYKGEKVNYNIGNKNCENISNINDNNYESYYQHNNLNSSLIIKLEETYNLNDLEIVIYCESSNKENIGIYIGENIPLQIKKNNTHKYIINFDKTILGGYVDYYCLEYVKLNKYYKEEKIIKNQYVLDGENLILDDYILDYKYFKRDKLILKDNLLIDNEDLGIDDFILHKTDNVSYKCDIDYSKNGKYFCEFNVGNNKFKEEVLVDLKSNIEQENNVIYDNNIIEKNNSKDIVLNEESKIEKINKESTNIVKNNKSDKTNFVNELVEEKNDNNSSISSIELSNKEVSKVNDKDKKDKTINKSKIFIIKIIIGFILISIEIYFILKRKRYNVETI